MGRWIYLVPAVGIAVFAASFMGHKLFRSKPYSFSPTSEVVRTVDVEPPVVEEKSSKCTGPGDINHLFSAYEGLSSVVDEQISTNGYISPSIERAYGLAEERIADARRILSHCDNPGTYDLATFQAIEALEDITQVLAQQEDMMNWFVVRGEPGISQL